MSDYAKILSLSYDNAIAEKTFALKSYYRSVRLIKTSNIPSPDLPSYITNVLLCGRCVDPETRCLYVFYIDTLARINQSTGLSYNSSWIIEINIDTRVQAVVYYDKYNTIGFDPNHKIYNARVVHGRIIWTDDLNPVYQIDIARAKKSFYYGIGYGQYPVTEEWSNVKDGGYGQGQIVSYGNSFYESLVFNNDGINPGSDDGTSWKKLCTIEDAYYSMNIKNFYFEPVPPKHPPTVTYKSDNNRKINNLRQTLFQISYRYVYMDWRKSTFSPASIVPVPQAEEMVATGLANEQISLNNQLEITFDSGGEEVRAIEIIGRSSQDLSKWFLIDTVEKFTSQEKGNELSTTVGLPYAMLGMALPAPTIISSSRYVIDAMDAIGLTLPTPTIITSYVRLSESDLSWGYNEFYPLGVKTVIATIVSSYAEVVSKPSWLTIFKGGSPISIGSSITSGDSLDMFPTVQNSGLALTGVFTVRDVQGDEVSLTVSQEVNPAGIQVHVVATIPPPLSIVDNGCTGTYGSPSIIINFTPNHPSYGPGQTYTVSYIILKNGSNAGSGSFIVNEQIANNKTLTMGSSAQNGDTISVYLQYNS